MAERARDKPGVENVLVERNFVGCRVVKNFAGDVGRQEGKRYFVTGGKDDDVGACNAAVGELHGALRDALDVGAGRDAAARDVVDEGGGDGGLALRDAHLRVETPGEALQARACCCCGKSHHLKGLPHCMLTMSSNRGAVRERGRANARRDT